jgi:hypothetical protein
MIDKEKINNFIGKYTSFYVEKRKDSSRSEKYKWEKLPIIHEDIFSNNTKLETLQEKLQYLDKNKQNRVSYM